MKSFVTSGTGNQQTLEEIESDKIPVYDSEADLDADLANLAVGQLVATKDTGTELSQPVDTVASGNLHAVTSNAVAQVISFVDTEQEAGYYFGGKRYHKTYVLKNVSIVADTPQVIQSNFEIPINKIVNVDGFATDGNSWFKDLNIYFANPNNSLCVYPKLGGSTYYVVIDVYYIK